MKGTIKRAWDAFTDEYQGWIFHPQFFTARAVQKGIDAVKLHAKGVLVDVGCGRMAYRNEIEPLVEKYIAVDNPKTASLYHGKWKPDIYADAAKLPLKDKSADTVILLQVLEYLENPKTVFREAYRILRKDGIFVISVPFMYPIHDVPYDLARYTGPLITKLLEREGFSILSFSAEGTFLDFWEQALSMFIMKRINDILKERKRIDSYLYLFFLVAFGIPTILLSNIIVYFCDLAGRLFPKYPNYFPLDYIIIATKMNK